MKRIFGAALAMALAGGLGAACSGQTSGGTGGGSGPVAQAEFVPALVDALCDGLAGCCQQAGHPYDSAKCRSGFEAFYGAFLPSGPQVKYDAAAAGRCISALRGAAAGCAMDDDSSDQECEAVFEGSTPLGGPCESSADCDRPADGAPVDCVVEEDPATGAYTGKCALDTDETVAPGGSCESTSECKTPAGAERAECDFDSSGQVGTCVALTRGKAGDACRLTCTQQGSSGWACSGGSGSSEATALCYTDDGVWCADSGTCEALTPIGGACGYQDCVAGAFCDAGQCVAQRPPGSACQDDDECQGGYCADTEVCTAFKGPGDACVDWDECGPDAYCVNDVCEASSGGGFVSAGTCQGEMPFGP